MKGLEIRVTGFLSRQKKGSIGEGGGEGSSCLENVKMEQTTKNWVKVQPC